MKSLFYSALGTIIGCVSVSAFADDLYKLNPLNLSVNMPQILQGKLPPACLIENKLQLNSHLYSVQISPKSKVKNFYLTNKNIKLKIYNNGNPRGYFDVKTDENQCFWVKGFKDINDVGIEIVSIDDQKNYHASCYGYAKPKQHHIEIICKKV